MLLFQCKVAGDGDGSDRKGRSRNRTLMLKHPRPRQYPPSSVLVELAHNDMVGTNVKKNF